MAFSVLVEKVKKYPLLTALIVIGCGIGVAFALGSFGKKDTETRYTLAAADRGTLLSSLSGSGQVSSVTSVEVKPKANSDVVLSVTQNGKEVKAGDTLAVLDSRDAQKDVRDAVANLESARLALKKIRQPADALTLLQAQDALAQAKRELEDVTAPPDAFDLLQAEHSLVQARESKDKANNTLKKSYEDAFNDVSNTFLDMPGIMTGLEDMWFKNTFERAQQNIDWYANQVSYWDTEQKALFSKDTVYKKLLAAKSQYDSAYALYRSTVRTWNQDDIEKLLSESYNAVRDISETVKASSNYIDLVRRIMEQQSQTIPATVTTHQNSLGSHTAKTNSHLSSLFSDKQDIQDARQAITNGERSIAEKQESYDTLHDGPDSSKRAAAQEKVREKEEALKKMKSGADALDIESQNLTIRRNENALSDAKEKLADYTISSPIGGIVANYNIKKGDAVSQGTAIATIITKKQLADVTLNEVDVAKVSIGDKATMTFDALQELTLTGAVVDIDVIGAQSQGVVSYNAKISMDAVDDRVKPGMSVTASIITDVKQNVLRVPNSAIKTQGASHYVEIPDTTETLPSNLRQAFELVKPIQRQPVDVGISNDEFTEVVSGLNEGDRVITGKSAPQAKPSGSQSSAPAVRIPGLPGQQGGGNVRSGGGGGGFR